MLAIEQVIEKSKRPLYGGSQEKAAFDFYNNVGCMQDN
jgi:hypothetical protein